MIQLGRQLRPPTRNVRTIPAVAALAITHPRAPVARRQGREIAGYACVLRLSVALSVCRTRSDMCVVS